MGGASSILTTPGGVPIPADRLYNREHIWILTAPESRRRVRIGLTAYACRWGIEVYFVENLPAPGTQIRLGDDIGRIETEKTVMTLHAPMDGKVAAVNERVLADPTIITFDNYGDGWIVELEGDPDGLWFAAEYVAFLKTLPAPQCFMKP